MFLQISRLPASSWLCSSMPRESMNVGCSGSRMKWLSLKPRSYCLPKLPGLTRGSAFSLRPGAPMAGSPTIGTTFALAGAGRLRAGADKAVLGLGIGPMAVGLEWGPSGLALCLDDATAPDLRACRRRHCCGCRRDRRSTQRRCRGESAGGGRFLWSPVCIRSAKIARGGRCGIYRSCEIVHVTPRLNLEELPVFVFSCQPADDDATVYSRMFGPCIGIPEDPATAPLVGHWAHISFSTTQCQPTMPRGS